MFKPVSREQNRLRLALDGPAGSGKTFTALTFAFALAGPKGRIAVIDTEHHTASKYSGKQPDGSTWSWDHCDLDPGQYSPSSYAQAIIAAGQAGYDVLVVDSLSHAWIGTGGALDQIDRSKDANKFTAWRDVSPQCNALVESILTSCCHTIVTLRSKMEYVLEADEKGKMVPRKVGMKPVQREGIEYEFDLLCDIDINHTMHVSKSRCSAVDGQVVHRPTGAWIEPVKAWLYSGETPPSRPQVFAPTVEPPPLSAPVATTTPHVNGIGKLVIECKTLAQRAGWTVQQLKGTCQQAGVEKLIDLGEAPLRILKQRLEGLIETQTQAKQVF